MGQGLSQLKEALGRENYDVKRLNAIEAKEVPKDCAVLVVAGSRSEWPEKLRAVLDEYVKKDGRMIVWVAPILPRPGASYRSFLKGWGVEVGDDLLLDYGVSMGGDPSTPAIVKFNTHEITRGLQGVFVAAARSVRPAEGRPTDLSVSSLLESSSNSWAETDLAGLRANKPPRPDGKDVKGPVPVGVAVTKGKSRLVVLGNTMFATNQMFSLAMNQDLAINSINWCAGEEDLISIHAKTQEKTRVDLTNRQMNVIKLVTIVLLPLAVLAFGVGGWFLRR